MVDHADPSGEGVTERPSRSEAVRSVVRASTGGDLEVIRFAVGPLPVPRSLGASFAYLTTRASRRADPDARKGRAAQAHAQAAAPRRRQQCQRLEAIRRSLLSWTKRDSSGRRAFRRRSRPRNRGGRASRRGRERPLCQLNQSRGDRSRRRGARRATGRQDCAGRSGAWWEPRPRPRGACACSDWSASSSSSGIASIPTSPSLSSWVRWSNCRRRAR